MDVDGTGDDTTAPWRDVASSIPRWSLSNTYYRIKPEPKLRPWTPAEAIGKVVRLKLANDPTMYLITKAGSDRAQVGIALWSYEDIIENCVEVKPDGTTGPCGVPGDTGATGLEDAEGRV